MTDRIDELRSAWDERQQKLGATRRAVLFKRFPGFLNDYVHRLHVHFILDQLPANTGKLLDVGCGFGRISREIKQRFPSIQFQGVDLCEEFAREYERSVGPCFNGPVQSFENDGTFDAIVVVTLLMYLEEDEQKVLVDELWSRLSPAGRIICIEPAREVFDFWRKVTGRDSASPTGGHVAHFYRRDLENLLSRGEPSAHVASQPLALVPGVTPTVLHHGVAVSH